MAKSKAKSKAKSRAKVKSKPKVESKSQEPVRYVTMDCAEINPAADLAKAMAQLGDLNGISFETMPFWELACDDQVVTPVFGLAPV